MARLAKLLPLALVLAACGASTQPADGGADVVPGDVVNTADTHATDALDVPATDARNATDVATGTDVVTPPDAGPDVQTPVEGGCVLLTDDPTDISKGCDPSSTTDCASPYICAPFSGAILTHQCELRCTDSCQCPTGTQCLPVTDKAGTRTFCR